MDIDYVVSKARSAKSLLHREEIAWLCLLADMAPDGTTVELGVYCGSSLIAISLARVGRGTVIGVDNWGYKDIQNLHEKCLENFRRTGVAPLLCNLDTEVAATAVNEPLAFLHIDADHSRPFIEKDIKLWTPKLVSGGIVAFHDYGRHKNNCAVTEIVNEWQVREPWESLGVVSTMAGYRKP